MRFARTVGGLILGVLLVLGAGRVLAAGTDTMLFVAPARPSVLQALQEILRQRPGHLLVSYQAGTVPDEPVLYAWDGADWVYLPLPDYRLGAWASARPRRALLLGPDEILPDRLVEMTETWVPVVLSVPDLDTASVLNAAGRLLEFRPAEWRWFARRFRMDLTDENEPLREDTWYDQPQEPRRFEPPAPPVPPRRRRARRPERDPEPVAPAPVPVPVRTDPPPRPPPPPPPSPEPLELEDVETPLPPPLPAAPAPRADEPTPPASPEPGIK